MTRFDIVLGHYVFCSQNHGGQGSSLYERLCRITRYFKPGAGFSESRFFDRKVRGYEAAREVYQALCRRHGVPDPFQGLIAIARDDAFAPACFILCRVKNPEAGPGKYDWDERDEENTLLIQTDHDFPGLARTFGWDGDDPDIPGAAEYLDRSVDDAKVVEDPGYFDTEEGR
jgi:hypothetical protein